MHILTCIREQHLSIRQAVYNMLTHDWTILLFYQSCSIMLTVLLHGCWANFEILDNLLTTTLVINAGNQVQFPQTK